MRKTSQIFVFILINIIVSAVTVLLVLWLWEKAHPTPRLEQDCAYQPIDESNPSQIQAGDPAGQEDDPTDSISFVTDDLQVVIRAIVGPGNLDVEYVEIRNQSQGAINLTGWQLTDQDGNLFVFPAMILHEGGTIKILSKKGNDTVIELYWQSDVPIWQSGETASLLNAGGDVIATYSIP